MGKWANLVLALASIIVALALAEGGARLLNPPFESTGGELYRCDRQLGWRGVPNVSLETSFEGHPYTITRNSRGMHDSEHPVEKAAGVFRILVLGDSFIEAIQLAEAQSSHQILEDRLNAAGPAGIRFEVISAGIAAWGPAQELRYFQTEGVRYQPDLVLAVWVPANDLLDILPDYRLTYGGINCYAPYFSLCSAQEALSPWYSAPGLSPAHQTCPAFKQIAASALNWLYHRSRLYQQLEPLLMANSPRLEYGHPYAPWLDHNQEDKMLDYAYRLSAQIYAQLKGEADQAGAKTALAIVAPKQAVYGALDSAWSNQLPADLQSLDTTLPNRRFTALMAERALPVLDLHPTFVRQLQASPTPLYWEADSHWNVSGNALAGQAMADWLIENQLVPTE